MDCFLVQDWVTIQGPLTLTSFPQPENSWLDLSKYQDAVAWLDVKAVGGGTGAMKLLYETSPTEDDALFVTAGFASNLIPGIYCTPMIKLVNVTPIARWLRWRITFTVNPTANWGLTFRLWVAANRIGNSGRRAQAIPTDTTTAEKVGYVEAPYLPTPPAAPPPVVAPPPAPVVPPFPLPPPPKPTPIIGPRPKPTPPPPSGGLV